MSSPSEFSAGSNPYQSPASSHRGVVPDPASAISDRTLEMLRQTKPWVRFLSILGFIGTVGLVIIALVIGFGNIREFGPAPPAAVAAVYGFMAFLYWVGSLYLFRYASRIAKLLDSREVIDLESALEAQKSFWRLLGILAAAVLVLYLVIIVAAAVVGVMNVNR